MSEEPSGKPGEIMWHDLTVPDAESVRDFYSSVVGWTYQAEDMGGYSDYTMTPEGGRQGTAGVCHARGVNIGVPAQWLMYVVVADLSASIERCLQHGGKVVHGPRSMESGGFCVIEDPAGAVCALVQATG